MSKTGVTFSNEEGKIHELINPVLDALDEQGYSFFVVVAKEGGEEGDNIETIIGVDGSPELLSFCVTETIDRTQDEELNSFSERFVMQMARVKVKNMMDDKSKDN